MVNMLLDEGAEIDRSEAGMLGSPLDAACKMERVDAVKLLVDRGGCATKVEGERVVEGVMAKRIASLNLQESNPKQEA